MRESAHPWTTPSTPHRLDSPSAAAHLDARLTAAAANTARDFRPLAADWPEDDFEALVYATALVRLKSELPHDTFDDLRRHYHERRAEFLARLRERAD